jgi:hypothetical protein
MKINTKDVLRHNFAIWVMGRRPGWFKPQRYMYRCLRCKWAFMVNDEHSGSLRVAADTAGELTAAEEQRRLDSFIAGPCPGYQEATAAVEQSNVIAMRRENRQIKRGRDARAM